MSSASHGECVQATCHRIRACTCVRANVERGKAPGKLAENEIHMFLKRANIKRVRGSGLEDGEMEPQQQKKDWKTWKLHLALNLNPNLNLHLQPHLHHPIPNPVCTRIAISILILIWNCICIPIHTCVSISISITMTTGCCSELDIFVPN